MGTLFPQADVIVVEGLEDLGRALRELFPPSKAAKIMDTILRRRAQPIADQAASSAPVRTGKLRRSIHVSNRLSKRQKSLHKKVDPADVEVFAGAAALDQSSLSEYGTSRQAPHPYMRPAWDSARAGLLNNLAQDIWNEIVKVATPKVHGS